jgi:hypothetical protein
MILAIPEPVPRRDVNYLFQGIEKGDVAIAS